MSLEPETAQAELDEIQSIARRTQRAIAYAGTGPILIVWGIVCAVCYTAGHFLPAGAWRGWRLGPAYFAVDSLVWGVGVTAGIVVTYVLAHPQRAPVKAPPGLGVRIGLLWFFAFVYVGVWLSILSPASGLQVGALIITVVMFVYVVMGLWFQAPLLTVLGLGITGLATVCYHALPGLYDLCLAVGAGGALIGSGLYVHRRWR